ncbi:MAG: ribosome-associated translation inhibitor RaiA [Ruminococcaceae bacterium]|nr:ribosome-associated translation inhibitor RaiA [Oscillospiraceae bacterium]
MNTTNFITRKCTLKDSFVERAEHKLAKVYKLLGEDASADVTVSSDNNEQKVEITAKSGSVTVRAEEVSDDRVEALDKAVDSLIRKIRKNKTRLERKIKGAPSIDSLFAEDEEKIYEETTFDIVREKRVQMKPQFVEEAILEMNLLGHNFYMFFNAETEEVNVIYKRKDGKYGLLMAEVL